MRKEKIFHFFSGPYQKPLGMLIFFSLQMQRGPTQKKMGGGGPFPIVQLTLYSIYETRMLFNQLAHDLTTSLTLNFKHFPSVASSSANHSLWRVFDMKGMGFMEFHGYYDAMHHYDYDWIVL